MGELANLEPCELISKFWKEVHYWEDDIINNWTPTQIFNYSPNGELMRVFDWYRGAQLYYKLIKCDCCDSYELKQVGIDRGTLSYIYRCENHTYGN